MRSTIKLLLLAIIGLISYNYFYGNEQEKARSQRVINEANDVFLSIKDLVVSEKEKFDAGKYDKALEKINYALQDVKEKSEDIGTELKDRLAKLEAEKEVLTEKLAEKEANAIWTETEKKQTQEDFQALIAKTAKLFKEVE